MSGDESPGTTPGTSPEAPEHSGSTPSGRAPEVSVVDLDMGYDKAAVLHHVSFTAPAGKTTVIMGPSGVGKSTLVKALLGLREVEHGDVVIGGRSVTDASPAELSTIRRGIGVMLGGNTVHDGSIFASKTAWENVRYPLEAHGYAPEEIEERAWRRMIEFGLTEHAHHRPDTMSGGQRRRLALARAFVADPQLLVLDDPGTALDLQNRQRIVESIRAARERTEATVLLTCHDIDMSRALGDHLVVLLEGRVVANGPAEELLEGIYETDEFDARFQFRASFDADTGNSLALVEADREFRTVFERLTFGALIGLGLIAVAGVVLIVILTAELVY